MEQAPRKLPPLKGLLVLAAVVRHQSFTGASQELGVTPSAVSKQVAQIEGWLGMTLFDRRGGGAVRARPEARKLADAMDAASDLLIDALTDIRPGPAETTLRVAAPATFAMRWLIPRLWGFTVQHPTVSVDVIQTHAADPLEALDYDVAIRSGPPYPPETQPRRVLTDALGLVMAPALLRSRRAGSADLSRVTLLESTSRPGELDRWIDTLRPRGAILVKRRRFPHFYIALEAALSGQGALVAPVVTLADLIHRGLLCEPLGPRRLPGGIVVAFSAPRREGGHGGAFLDWLEGMTPEEG